MKKKVTMWWDRAWNVMTGCTQCSPGCANCYASAMSQRFYGNFDVTLHQDRLDQPLAWRKPQFVFVCNMCDLFHQDVPFNFIDRVFAVMVALPKHTFCLLTKRPERMAKYINSLRSFEFGSERDCYLYDLWRVTCAETENDLRPKWPIPNVWLGVTAENQEYADKRIPILLSIPAAKRFVSVEPMLGPVDFTSVQFGGGLYMNTLLTQANRMETMGQVPDIEAINWVICGGESGPNARPMNPEWARDVRDQCVKAGVKYYFKQHGEWIETDKVTGPGKFVTFQDGITMEKVGKKKAGRLLDGRTWDERPEVKR